MNRSPVTAMDVFPVRWPLKMKRRHGVGDIAETMPGVVLRLETGDGIVGWGEAAPWSVFTGTAEGNAQALHVYLRPLVLGAETSAITSIMQAAEKAVVGHPEAKAALEMALSDIEGQRLGVPVATLLGGFHRREIPLSVSIANPDFDEDLAFAEARLADGVRIFKVKTGFLSHADDLHRLERLRAILPPDADLRIDYNQGLDPWNALGQLREMERFRPTFIEQPVKRDQRRAMGALAAALDTPLMADESVFTPAEAVELAAERYADIVSVKLMKAGGFRRASAIAAIAEAAGIPAYGGTMFEGGIASAAGLHWVAATPNVSLGAEFYTSTYVMGADVLTTPLVIREGRSIVPDGPGLGIVVDEDRVRSLCVERLGD
ncbi:enolase C-terminal domain-like protein [Marinivivus vitaminiproducens]|uniref:enolase C-terminal domain-like protein n=1 Tax=Marinivivus vitaminiproducens TaxID=3035935 RepID=UPI00279AACED|nr:enolase C-terminal domain-like protein [Geminicoccaceae bacterium SCSIO 64248]